MAQVKRRKVKAARKEDSIRIRVTEEQKEVLTEAASGDGLGVSSWLLSLGMKAAKAGGGPGNKP